jgi:hypothetical protein
MRSRTTGGRWVGGGGEEMVTARLLTVQTLYAIYILTPERISQGRTKRKADYFFAARCVRSVSQHVHLAGFPHAAT